MGYFVNPIKRLPHIPWALSSHRRAINLIYMSYRGILIMSKETLQRISQGETVDPSEYYIRTTPYFETGSEKYDWLNRIVAVGVGERTQSGVSYKVYAIL